ncbi:MAG: helix-turn-helix domain-containing protein [Methanomicrobiales archaeon]|nr:helix-turn-helix domain-containing protein [Methanomicrobiales archaeon]MDI6877160.1 helix-turn-helix domain-containing protein [Methanomicrobiales archaeon]
MKSASSTDIYYGAKTERIYRVLLSRKLKNPTRYRIAKEAGVSYTYVFNVLRELEREGIIREHILRDPEKLFYLWAGRKETRLYREYNIQNPAQLFKDVKKEYAITGYFAENLMSHYLFPRSVEFYIKPGDQIYWHNLLMSNGYAGKGNVKIILTDPHVFYERSRIDHYFVVSIQQLIVDLIREGAECREAADILIKRVYYDR